MENKDSKKYYLNYMNGTDEIYIDLLYAVQGMKTIQTFDAFKFYYCLNKIIENVIDVKIFDLIKSLPSLKPVYVFGFIYYLLKDSCDYNKYKLEFEYLFNFIDCKTDVFMIVNYLRTK